MNNTERKIIEEINRTRAFENRTISLVHAIIEGVGIFCIFFFTIFACAFI